MRKSYSFRIVIEFILLVLHCLHSFNVNWAFVSVVYISLRCFSMLQCLLVFCCMFLSLLFIKEFPKCINLKWHWFQLKRMQLCYIVCAANCHRNDLQDCRLTNRTKKKILFRQNVIRALNHVSHHSHWISKHLTKRAISLLLSIDWHRYSFKCAYVSLFCFAWFHKYDMHFAWLYHSLFSCFLFYLHVMTVLLSVHHIEL